MHIMKLNVYSGELKAGNNSHVLLNNFTVPRFNWLSPVFLWFSVMMAMVVVVERSWWRVEDCGRCSGGGSGSHDRASGNEMMVSMVLVVMALVMVRIDMNSCLLVLKEVMVRKGKRKRRFTTCKRRRLNHRTNTDARSWANLPGDMLGMISKRLNFINNLSFGGVCKSWREELYFPVLPEYFKHFFLPEFRTVLAYSTVLSEFVLVFVQKPGEVVYFCQAGGEDWTVYSFADKPWLIMDLAGTPSLSTPYLQLVILNEELLMLDKMHSDPLPYKLDLTNMEWVRVERLGNVALFKHKNQSAIISNPSQWGWGGAIVAPYITWTYDVSTRESLTGPTHQIRQHCLVLRFIKYVVQGTCSLSINSYEENQMRRLNHRTNTDARSWANLPGDMLKAAEFHRQPLVWWCLQVMERACSLYNIFDKTKYKTMLPNLKPGEVVYYCQAGGEDWTVYSFADKPWLIMDLVGTPSLSTPYLQLVILNEELLMLDKMHSDPLTYKLDLTNMEWVRVERLGNVALFKHKNQSAIISNPSHGGAQ
ncbi:hypothetical protein TEA_022041 [Camellia sinensis var. sinensis]|uniref:F-box domain-containing protein n=1 Tax=Camellia sinensis var. sinensis TaxID=542762 RepID=A0A4S4DNU1_CAMSN|nr:hypothetical protein TEA_022041 [Camellia sinensis var. sinensis]